MHVDYAAPSRESENLGPKEYFKEALDFPYFLRIENVLDTGAIKYEFGLKKFYRRFMSDSVAMTELFRYSVDDGGVLISSVFSDSLYMIKDDLSDVNNVFQIKSDVTGIGVAPVNLLEDDYSSYLLDIVRYKGYISRAYFDIGHNVYVVVVSSEHKKGRPESHFFTFCIYSPEGVKLNEITLKVHIIYLCIVQSTNNMIRR